jgi:hypothetical protein
MQYRTVLRRRAIPKTSTLVPSEPESSLSCSYFRFVESPDQEDDASDEENYRSGRHHSNRHNICRFTLSIFNLTFVAVSHRPTSARRPVRGAGTHGCTLTLGVAASVHITPRFHYGSDRETDKY